MKLLAWSRTDTGRKRDHNEDSHLTDSSLNLYAVADGMGGHQGGAFASQHALQVLKEEVERSLPNIQEMSEQARDNDRRARAATLDPEADQHDADDDDDGDTTGAVPVPVPGTEDTMDMPAAAFVADILPPASAVMKSAARRASASVFAVASGNPELRGMGTTMTAMLYESGRMHLVHAGDSRAYLFRDGTIRQLTEDHSWIQEQLTAGMMTEEEAEHSEYRHVITRSIGFERDVDADTAGVVVQAGDCFLLCSDGMSNYVDVGELERLMGVTWFRRLPSVLVDLANDRGGDDNITVVVIYAANDLS
jgi:protein phosphatase